MTLGDQIIVGSGVAGLLVSLPVLLYLSSKCRHRRLREFSFRQVLLLLLGVACWAWGTLVLIACFTVDRWLP